MKVLMTGASNIGQAGVATIAYRLGQNISTSKIKIGYLAQNGLSDVRYKNVIEEKGNHVYIMENTTSRGGVARFRQLTTWIRKIICVEEYDAIHINSDTAYLAAAYIWIANGAKEKKRKDLKIIVHSHSTMVDEDNYMKRMVKTFFHKICIHYVNKNTDMCFACSSMAAEWMFGKRETTTIPNGLDSEKFCYSVDAENRIRDELELKDNFVICSVGRLAYQKNPFFTIDIFREILNIRPNSKLLLVGDGPLRESIREYIDENNLTETVLLLGNRVDIPDILSASNAFLLPSRFEGLGIVYIEAQLSGIPVFASDAVPNEAFITPVIYRCSLNSNANEWADVIMEHANDERMDTRQMIMDAGYDIKNASALLQQMYFSLGAYN